MNLENDYVGLILSAPSGTGKSTLCQMLSKKYPEVKISISITTRPKRAEEVEGVHYHFRSLEDYNKLVADKEMLETAKVYDNFYGTQKSLVQNILNQGNYVAFDIEYHGMKQLKQSYLKDRLITVFLLPPSLQELENRIRKRSIINNTAIDEESIKKRLKSAEQEMNDCVHYDFVVVNENLDNTFANLCSIYETFFKIKNNNKKIITDVLPILLHK